MKTAIALSATATMLCLCLAGNGQNGPAVSVTDPFIAVVENMKHSVAPLACVAVNGIESKLLARKGTAFFVSTGGEFMTAAHVLQEMQKNDPLCPVAAVILPRERRWQPSALDEPMAWFSFKVANCIIKQELDLAKCPLTDDPPNQTAGLEFRIVPVKFDWSIPPDATQVAFTGFPINVRDPMTLRADVAAYQPVWRNEKVIAELLLDRAAWPGFSGSPVFLSDGSVIGILIGIRTEQATAMTAVRSISAARSWLEGPEKK